MKELQSLSVRDVMTTKVLTFSPDQDLGDAVALLLRKGYAGAPVVDEKGQLVGVLSEDDCLGVLVNAVFDEMPEGAVGLQMTTEVDTVAPEDDFMVVARQFSKSRHRWLPVTKDRAVVGVVARRDVLRTLAKLEKKRGTKKRLTTDEVIERRIHHN